MKIVDKIPFFLLAGFIYLLIYSSCANRGTPSGGPRDSIPPVVVKTEPEYQALNFTGDEIRLTFNEYIVYDRVMEVLVVSPPLKERPSVKMRSKTMILEFNEPLRDRVTYSLDFKNSIEDNNEGNPLEGLRFVFSTWDVLDTLRVAGMVKNAAMLDPVANALVMLYRNLHDSAVYTLIPDYIAKTDERGFFLFDNLARDTYQIFAIHDLNSDRKYNEGVEEIAFHDSLLVPDVYFVEEPDTLVSGADSLLISGHYHFTPEPVFLRLFMEDFFSQFLTASERDSRNRCRFIFEESVQDTFAVTLLNFPAEEWYLQEATSGMDTITLWITDTLVARIDTLELELRYNKLDSTGFVYVARDTTELIFYEEEVPPRRGRRDQEDEEEKVPPVPQFGIADNLKSSGFDLNKPVWLTMPQPLKHFYTDRVHLYYQEDTTGTPLSFTLEKDTSAWRRYILSHEWEAGTEYRLEIDSAACENIFGVTNRKLVKKFQTQKEDYYGTIQITTQNVKGSVILQLVKKEGEEFVRQQTIDSDEWVVFETLAPNKYLLKAIYDSNENGQWDPGRVKKGSQPEKVAYFPKVFKVRSNWEQQETWDLTIDPSFPKDIYDPDMEEQRKNEARENRSRDDRPSSGFGIGQSSRSSGVRDQRYP
jgi:hypothetical protein